MRCFVMFIYGGVRHYFFNILCHCCLIVHVLLNEYIYVFPFVAQTYGIKASLVCGFGFPVCLFS